MLGLAGLLAACQPAPPHREESFVFGTRIDVQIADLPEGEAHAATAEVLREFDRLHQSLHAWQPSEVTRLNAALAAGETFTASPELAALLSEAQAMARDGEYLFDPGIGRLIGLWGFQRDEFTPVLPDPQALAAWQRARPSIGDLTIAGRQVSSRNRQVAIDLGGYAKGYALDRAATLLRARGVKNALINIGGNILALGDKHGTPWKVGIRAPRGAGQLAVLDLRDGEAIGTSGDYQRYFEVDGRRYSHLLDPRSGRPAEGTQAVTVLIPGGPGAGVRSDVFSKPLFIGGGGEFARLAGKLGVGQALRVDASGRVEVTAALARRLDFGERPPALTVLP
jgi:thiamine biosynthesis lipoprotein